MKGRQGGDGHLGSHGPRPKPDGPPTPNPAPGGGKRADLSAWGGGRKGNLRPMEGRGRDFIFRVGRL